MLLFHETAQEAFDIIPSASSTLRWKNLKTSALRQLVWTKNALKTKLCDFTA